jgi:hypothetical protein
MAASGVARLKNGRSAAVFFPFGHPTLYAYEEGQLRKSRSDAKFVNSGINSNYPVKIYCHFTGSDDALQVAIPIGSDEALRVAIDGQ